MISKERIIKNIKSVIDSQASPVSVFLHLFYYKVRYKKIILKGSYTTVKGIKNIKGDGKIKIALMPTGFNIRKDLTLLSISKIGELNVTKYLSIGKGCRFDISGTLNIGNAFFNSGTKVIVTNKVIIGDNCAFSWGCTIMDNDFHQFNKNNPMGEIIIGNNVWVGCNSTILKNTTIPNGCVIASNSVVSSKFDEENCLIAGNPAKIVKRNIIWNK